MTGASPAQGAVTPLDAAAVLDAATVLDVRRLGVSFATRDGPLQAVDDVTFQVRPGEIVGLVGETGCGKTVTGLSILGLLPSNATASGSITLQGRELLGSSERELRAIRGATVSMVFQNPRSAFNPVFSLGSQMRHVLRAHLGLRGSAANERIEQTLAEVGLPNAAGIVRSYAHQLSGGMLQRAMIAMALLCKPSLLIADEPTSALDVSIAAQILDLLRSLRDRMGLSVLLITHDLGVVRSSTDRVLVLYAGRIAEDGETSTVLAAPRHPYTRGLLAAVPRATARRGALNVIPGLVPANPGTIEGCAFVERCPLAIDLCVQVRPELLSVAPGHAAACHLAHLPAGQPTTELGPVR